MIGNRCWELAKYSPSALTDSHHEDSDALKGYWDSPWAVISAVNSAGANSIKGMGNASRETGTSACQLFYIFSTHRLEWVGS